MAKEKLGFDDFISTVNSDCQPFVTELHHQLTESGCKIEVKSAKSGYVVSYLLNKKTLANYVFRKKGLMVRIYANHIGEYMELLDTIPREMAMTIKDASICKRMIDPGACNPKCLMGYDFILNGEHHQKCRNNAFMFLVCDENKPFIKAFLLNEIKACN